MNIRPATREDLAAVAELFGSVEEAVTGRPSRLDAMVVEGWLQTISYETNTWLLDEDGQLVAGAFAMRFGRRGNSAGAVRPSAWGRGLGGQLIDLVEARLGDEGVERLHSWTVAGDAAADELFRSRDYREVRRFWEMAIELDDDPPEAPADIELFTEGDAEAFHAALEESFAEHWEHSPESFDEWWERQRRRTNFDPSLWFVIRDGDELVGVVRNEARPPAGYVGALGVRRGWRGRGYGRALLLHSFGEFHRRGLRHVTLGVDAANATGATQLYESVGMHAEQENVVWEKSLA
ncbi:MAG TPA: GNAT family N-acetyltransferase [Gaiellaceae bacterium]|nr:GNAT family N-acetyltransferase [Gaiellaceae bacterium]